MKSSSISAIVCSQMNTKSSSISELRWSGWLCHESKTDLIRNFFRELTDLAVSPNRPWDSFVTRNLLQSHGDLDEIHTKLVPINCQLRPRRPGWNTYQITYQITRFLLIRKISTFFDEIHVFIEWNISYSTCGVCPSSVDTCRADESLSSTSALVERLHVYTALIEPVKSFSETCGAC